ncbi:MAG: hypothetical protein ONB44_23050 [candidate division KSB1 bacterium]|nr:hypothetical protein [candidate division KSB1 bacterium]MDZ7305018.1 hypothetical protein [candidate division KSB1 bacterium]MDZ7314137.1 hypothetical protein [candidate division KSB1 bacterium]
MQTATLKEVTRELGISLDDVVYYHTLGDKAFIQIDLNLSQPNTANSSKPTKPQNIMTPEEEFRQKYPNIKISRPELFKLVGCMADVAPNVSDKDLIIDAIESKYGNESTC